MKYLLRKTWRDIRLSAGQHAAICAVIMLGVAFFVGLMSASEGVRKGIEAFYGSQRLAHFWVNGAFGADEVEKLSAIPGVQAAQGRMTFAASDGKSEFAAFSLTESVNVPLCEKGRLPENAGECAVDRLYFQANGLKLGDTVCGYTLTGVFNSPEYLYIAKSISETANHETYGALALARHQGPFNEILVRLDDGADPAQAKAAIKEALPQSVILGRQELFSWFMLNDDMEQFAKVGRVFPIIFFVVASAIILISMSKNVEVQRTQIGNMKALGIRPMSIMVHYWAFTAFACIVGCTFGALLGIFALMPFIQSIFTSFYTMPQMQTSGYAGNVAMASGLAFAFGTLATLISVRKPLAETPAAAMRPKVPKSVKPIMLERNRHLWGRLSFGHKIVLRNLFLNKWRALLSSIGIVGCVGLMLAAFAFLDCIDNILNAKFYEMNRYDIAVALKEATFGEFPMGEIENAIASAWPVASVPVKFETKEGAVSADLIALDVDCDAIALYGSDSTEVQIPANGAIVPKLYADRHDLHVGDNLTLSIAPLVGEPRTVTVRIAAVAVQYLGQDIYVSFGYLDGLGVSMPASSFYLTLKEGANVQELARLIGEKSTVRMCATKDGIANSWGQAMDIVYQMVYILVAAAAALSMTVVYNISAINIFERRRDVATLKVLGYRLKEVNRLVFRENLYITAFGSVLGIGAGVLMLWLLIHEVLSDEMYVPTVMSGRSVFMALSLGFAFTVLANQLLRGKIRRIDMVESLKSVE